MERKYTDEYTEVMKETIRGVQTRAFFFGYASERVDNYFKSQKRKIWEVQEEAHRRNEDIYSRENLTLGAKLLELGTKSILACFAH
jgi:hypothetical protein